ncbi:MAG: MerR family transcriptional regulator [Fibrobacter sp.]|nr:MerR family transcriptional regulator [Fibrobacter sp.]
MQKFRQKEFSFLTGLTRKALLIYEEKGLLLPAFVDEDNGYRYYSVQELAKANYISFLKNYELSIDDMKKIVEKEISLGDYFNKKRLKKALLERLTLTQNCLKALEVCENHPELFYEHKLLLKHLAPQFVFSLEGQGKSHDISRCFAKLNSELSKNAFIPNGNSFTFYFANSHAQELHFKCCVPIQYVDYCPLGQGQTEFFPQTKLAYAIHFGNYEALPYKYDVLTEKILAQNLLMTGEFIETYIIGSFNNTESTSFITEIAAVLL